MLTGTFEKFNSNFGFEDLYISPVLSTLTHWSHESTGGEYLLCDLQGILFDKRRLTLKLKWNLLLGTETSWGFELTDPVIHSRNRVFAKTLTDLRTVGMRKVLAGHKCNRLCRLLRLGSNTLSEPALSDTTVYTRNYTCICDCNSLQLVHSIDIQ